MSEDFGTYVRRKRKEKGFSLREFATMLGVSRTYVSRFEKGWIKPPSRTWIRKISDILDVNEDNLLAMSGRLPDDLVDIIMKHPAEISAFLRIARNLDAKDWKEMMHVII